MSDPMWLHDEADPRLEPFCRVRDRQWLTQRGLFVAEGCAVVELALESPAFRVVSLLLTEGAYERLLPRLSGGDPPRVLLSTRAVMRATSGVSFHQGCVALVEVPAPSPKWDLRGEFERPRVLVIEDVTDPDNIGGLFRNAFAFGVSGVLLSPRCASPFYRKALRTSLGAGLRIPFLHARDSEHWVGALDQLSLDGMSFIALTPRAGPQPLSVLQWMLADAAGVAICVGNEGTGLSSELLERASVRWAIPMARGADSVNVSTASGIVLARLFEWDQKSLRGSRPGDTNV